ncbi:hypothetical protein BKA69DRAFT_1088083 [Paraphysoderma sedebokerense]|nr:hypothetical protein BKA69DRAFT_1087944 [Paraphysoderma sedebokerense]KAI9139059.1 hypothetical protein BKA69DRAFT_1088083 [Paraphysoderma sedebokerense]
MKLNVIGPKSILAKFSKSKSYPSSAYDKPVCRSNKKPSMSLGGAINVKPSYTLVVRSPGSVDTGSSVQTIKPEEQQYTFHTPQPTSQSFGSPIVSSSFPSSPEEPPSTPSSPSYEFRTPLSPNESLPSISSILGDYLTPTHEPTSPPPLSIPLRSPTPSQPLGRPQSPLPQTPSTPIPSRHSSKDAYLRSCSSPVEYAQGDIHNQTSDTELSYTKPKSKLGWSSKRNHSGSSKNQNNSYHVDYFNYSPFRSYHNQMTSYNDTYGYRSSGNTPSYTNWDRREATEDQEESSRNQGMLEEIYFETV